MHYYRFDCSLIVGVGFLRWDGAVSLYVVGWLLNGETCDNIPLDALAYASNLGWVVGLVLRVCHQQPGGCVDLEADLTANM